MRGEILRPVCLQAGSCCLVGEGKWCGRGEKVCGGGLLVPIQALLALACAGFCAGPNFLASGVRSGQPAKRARLAAVLHVHLSSTRVSHAPAHSDFVSS